MDSDPFVNFKIDHHTGSLTKIQEFPAGGMVPRHFSYSNDGTMVAVVLSRDQRVMIIDRDPKTGMLTQFKAWTHVDKEPSFVLWKQNKLSVSHIPLRDSAVCRVKILGHEPLFHSYFTFTDLE